MLTDAQLAVRRTGVGASEIAAVCGLSKWRTPHQVWFSKIYPEKAREEFGAAALRGNIKEPMLVEWYKATTGRTVTKSGDEQETVRHPDHPIVLATPDGYVDEDGLIECKAPGKQTIMHWGQNGTDDIPEYYLPQGIWQMAATGRHWVDYAVDLGDELGVFRLNYKEDLFQSLLVIAEQFWADYVEKKVPPPPDHTDGCTETLLRLHPNQMQEPLGRPDDDTVVLMERYRQAGIAVKEAKREENLVKNLLKSRIGDHRGFEDYGGNKVIWYQVKGRTKTDWEAIARELGADEERIQRHTSVGPSSRSMRGYWKG